MHLGGVPHIVGKLLIKAKKILETSSQSEVFTRNYWPLK
jgi:hypothetical protein